jgi:hypothetical protein
MAEVGIAISVHGKSLVVTHVRLYPSTLVREWQSMVAKASTLMGGVSSPIGFLGSPEWVVGGAVVSGLLTSALSSNMAKEGAKTLSDAAFLLARVRAAGAYYPIHEIEGIDLPYPQSWSAPGSSQVQLDYSKEAMLQRGAFLARHGKTKADVKDGMITVDVTVPFVVLDPEFVAVQTDDGARHVRWSVVDTYGLEGQ